MKPQNYDPVLSKFYEHFGIIIPHPLQNGEENTVSWLGLTLGCTPAPNQSPGIEIKWNVQNGKGSKFYKNIYNLWSLLRTNIELKSVFFLITNRKFTNRFKITKVISSSQVKPQNYDPVLSKFYEYLGIIIPHPLQNGEENTVLRGYSHYIPLLTKNVRPNKRPTSKNF